MDTILLVSICHEIGRNVQYGYLQLRHTFHYFVKLFNRLG